MDEKFMKEALLQAEKALKENEFPVGCVITLENKIIARGRREKTKGDHPGETEHAEINTIKKLHDTFPELPKEKMTVYSTMEPCLMCFSAIMLSGFEKVVYGYEDVMGGGCKIDKKNLPEFYKKRFPKIKQGVMRDKSLELFKSFFSSPKNKYWKDSPLYKYTLNL